MIGPWLLWIGFIAMIIFFLLVDLLIFNKKESVISIKKAIIWTAVWFGLAMLFNVFVWLELGHDAGLKFFTGYIIEKSLSMDNLFVMLVIFTSFKIAPHHQHKVLFWGIIGALILRGIMIVLGAALVSRFSWILYIFGAFLIYAGIKMFVKKEEEFDPHNSFIVRKIKKLVHVSRNHESSHFFVREEAGRGITILFVALLVIEFTDVIFAFDSIPAIFAITTDPFIVFSSNFFAMLGLRSLYFVVARAHDMFHYLYIGLAAILIFVGAKMLISYFIHIPTLISLGFVLGILFISILASFLHRKHRLKIFRNLDP